MELTKRGDRIRLLHCADPWTSLKPGATGTVRIVDDAGTVHVQWDNGSTLGLVREAGDRFVVLNR